MRELVPGVRDLQLCGQSRAGADMYVSAFVCAGPPTTLVDTGWAATADELVGELDAAGVDVDRVVLTHHGRDHFGGLDRVMARDDPELLVPAGEAGLVGAIDHAPDRRVEHGDVLAGGLEVVTVPGHTAAPASLYLPERRTLVAGDVLDGSDRRGLPPGHLLPPPETYNEDHAAAERNLDRLLAYDIESVLVFHGSHVLGDAGEKLARLVDFRERFQQPAGVAGSHPD